MIFLASFPILFNYNIGHTMSPQFVEKCMVFPTRVGGSGDNRMTRLHADTGPEKLELFLNIRK